MIDTKKLNEIVNKVAPYELAEEWDNCGLIVDCGEKTDKILFALDATNAVLEEAQRRGCGAVVTHHPAIFSGIKNLADGDPVLEAAKRHITLIAAHTCFDAAQGGVNDVLCDLLGVKEQELFAPIGRMGKLSCADAKALAALVKEKLGCDAVRYVDGGKPIERVAVIGGSAGEFVAQAKWMNLDAFITGELKHHEALYAQQVGVTVIAAGHYETENPAVEALRRAVEAEVGEDAACLLAEVCANPFGTV